MNETGLEAPAREAADAVGLRIIDADIHPRMNGMFQLYPYLSEAWRKRMGVVPLSSAKDPSTARNVFSIPKRWYYHPHGAERPDALPPDGGRPGSSLEMLRSHHLDKYGIDVGVLIAGDLFGIGGLPDADMAAAFIAANNDWLLHEWCEEEPRLKLAMHVGPRDPALAVREIERIGAHPDVVQVQLPQMDMLMGNRHFYPIYEAAEAMGLPVGMHGAGESAGVNTPMNPTGIPSYYIEVHTGAVTVAQAPCPQSGVRGRVRAFSEAEGRFPGDGLCLAAQHHVALRPGMALVARGGSLAGASAQRICRRPHSADLPAHRGASGAGGPPPDSPDGEGGEDPVVRVRLSALGFRQPEAGFSGDIRGAEAPHLS